MAKRHDIEQVRRWFRYDDGKLYWNPRPREQFATRRAFSTWNARYASTEAGTPTKDDQPRVRIKLDGRQYFRYQLVWAICQGEWLDQIDHKDTDPLNDRIENLRPCNHSENAANSGLRADNTSGYKGVYRAKRTGKYVAQIVVNQKNIYLGCYADPAEAHSAYVAAAKRHFGDFANAG